MSWCKVWGHSYGLAPSGRSMTGYKCRYCDHVGFGTTNGVDRFCSPHEPAPLAGYVVVATGLVLAMAAICALISLVASWFTT